VRRAAVLLGALLAAATPAAAGPLVARIMADRLDAAGHVPPPGDELRRGLDERCARSGVVRRDGTALPVRLVVRLDPG
jgi:hypothetical protein